MTLPALLLAGLALGACSAAQVREAAPEQKLAEARRALESRQYETATAGLEELRDATAGTRLGGEVQYLLAEAQFLQANYSEADSLYEAYLTAFPSGEFAEEAIYRRAVANLRRIERLRIGFFSFRSYVPHDRDPTPLREARGLFEAYLSRFPSGPHAAEAAERVAELRGKEGRHELEVAAFYLRQGQPEAALRRAEAVRDGSYPDAVRSDASSLAASARARVDGATEVRP